MVFIEFCWIYQHHFYDIENTSKHLFLFSNKQHNVPAWKLLSFDRLCLFVSFLQSCLVPPSASFCTYIWISPDSPTESTEDEALGQRGQKRNRRMSLFITQQSNFQLCVWRNWSIEDKTLKTYLHIHVSSNRCFSRQETEEHKRPILKTG